MSKYPPVSAATMAMATAAFTITIAAMINAAVATPVTTMKAFSRIPWVTRVVS